ncbi:MAG: hypothetical protein WCD11_16370 [Solirubrobacteraceae bacterium]
MSGFDDLQRQLLDAIERKGSRRAPRGSFLIIAASSAIVLVVAAAAIVALGGHKPPPSHPVVAAAPVRHHGRTGQKQYSVTGTMSVVEIGKAPPGSMSHVYAALTAVQSKDADCTPFHPNGAGMTVSEGAPSAYMLSVLGVLRHPSTAADRLPAPFYRPDHRLLPIGLARQVYIRYIRRARVVNGISYYIVPAAQVGPIAPPASVLNRCYAEEIQALKNQLGNVSASLRASTLKVGATLFTQMRATSARQRDTEGVVDLEWGSGGGGGGAGASPQTIEQHGSLDGDGSAVYGIVPSGVATVTLRWSGKRAPVTAAVVNNMFVLTAPRSGRTPVPPPKMVWRAANGRVIKTVSTP